MSLPQSSCERTTIFALMFAAFAIGYAVAAVFETPDTVYDCCYVWTEGGALVRPTEECKSFVQAPRSMEVRGE